jgi:hypothetical protein
MSYCRWSSVIPELSPNVDCSVKKMLDLIIYQDGGYAAYRKYLEDNGAVYSDAYVYEGCYGGFICHWKEEKSDSTETAGEMAEILIAAVKRGKRVPQSVIAALLEESQDNEVEDLNNDTTN